MSIDALLKRHAERPDAKGAAGTPAPPALHVAIVTCMDARIDVHGLFGLELGDAHVMRNAGGVVTDDTLRSLAISERKLGTREVLLMQHTRCGMATFLDDDFTEELAAEIGMAPEWRPHTFRDPETSVRRDLARIRRDPFLVGDVVARGFVLDIDTLTVTEVDPA